MARASDARSTCGPGRQGRIAFAEWESRGPKRALMTVEDAPARKLAEATIGKQKVLLGRLKAFA